MVEHKVRQRDGGVRTGHIFTVLGKWKHNLHKETEEQFFGLNTLLVVAVLLEVMVCELFARSLDLLTLLRKVLFY